MTTNLLSVQGLSVDYHVGRRHVCAVEDVSLDVGADETVGLVGESGSGKTTIARAVLGLAKARAGTIRFDDEDITHAGKAHRRRLSRDMQVVFQDPYGSLSPTRTVAQTLTEPLLAHRLASGQTAHDQAADMLARVGLEPDALRRYPREFSGGQRQRIAIARALMPSPRLVVCDEAVSALDLSVQAQVLNLLRDLQREYRLGYLFVAHNVSVVRHISDRIVVLYRGTVMESGPAEAVCTKPGHPYTRALLQAVPVADPDRQAARRAVATPAEHVSAPLTGSGCPFAARCPHVIDACRRERPPLVAAPGGTQVACIRAEELAGYSPPG
ncbi:ABC transporter ATP-binding protein [Streptomyces sp. NBC_01478]|uniref:ABC transporter ATP-binding protein n=1 Tax=Streptomyces TaxID=1883 RepID=UPI002E32403B|nr:ABC transporter ATP-binding protein [Streptomyces sp. NBC_01478]